MLKYERASLHFENHSLPRLAADIATPFFLVSEARIRENYQAIYQGLTANGIHCTIRYCAKTNHEAGVLRILQTCGSDLLVSHLAEAKLALEKGFNPQQLAFQRPILDKGEIEAAIGLGLRYFHAFRKEDIDLLSQAAFETGVQLFVSLRLRNGSPISQFSPIGFSANRLGFSEAEIAPAAHQIQSATGLDLAAINFHLGTQLESPNKYSAILRRAAHLSAYIQAHFNIPLMEINLGGGFPSPSIRRLSFSFLPHRMLGKWKTRFKNDLLEFSSSVSRLYDNLIKLEAGIPTPRLVVEPGRSIVGDAAILISRVRAIQGRWLFMDASRNFIGENPLFLSRQILPCSTKQNGPMRRYHLSGSTLNTTDVLDVWRTLPKQEPNDLLAFCGAGAYSISRATQYAGLSPAVYMVQTNGSLSLIRSAEDLSNLSASMMPAESTPLYRTRPS
jgi:diaminopimelate decarboxylase